MRSASRRWVRLSIIVGTIMLMSYSFMDSFEKYEETTKREQARYNLEHITSCVEKGSKKGVKGRDLWEMCTHNVRTSQTGDVYILDEKSYEFVYDNSNDVPSKKLAFTRSSVGSLFVDWESGLAARKIMTAGTDSSSSSRISYNFDGSPEWLEWKTWEHNGRKYVIVQGIQADEVYEGLSNLTYMFYTFMGVFILIIFMEMTTVPVPVKGSEYNRRSTDGS